MAVEFEIAFGLRRAVGRVAPGLQLLAAKGASQRFKRKKGREVIAPFPVVTSLYCGVSISVFVLLCVEAFSALRAFARSRPKVRVVAFGPLVLAMPLALMCEAD